MPEGPFRQILAHIYVCHFSAMLLIVQQIKKTYSNFYFLIFFSLWSMGFIVEL